MSTLYQLTGQMKAIEDILEENGGEITPELEGLWQETAESLPQKVDGYNQVITNAARYSENIAAEIKRLQGLKRTADNTVRRLKEHIADCMIAFGLARLDGNYCKISLSSSTSTEVDEETALAPYIARIDRMMLPSWVTCELKVNKTALKDEFKGKDVTPSGVRFVENKSIRIR